MKRKVGGNGTRGTDAIALTTFMFATGIENSYPVVTGKDGRDLRVDEMAKCRHYERWREDFRLVQGAGHRVPALRPALLSRAPRPRPVRLGVRRPDLRRTAAPGHHAHRRPLPLRRARLGRQFPESRLAARSSPSMPAPSPSASRGSASTRRSTRSSSPRRSPASTAGGTSG